MGKERGGLVPGKTVFKAAVGIAFLICGVLILTKKITINQFVIGKYPIQGVDVSHYQGAIDWEKLREQQVDFAFIKATEGSSHIAVSYTHLDVYKRQFQYSRVRRLHYRTEDHYRRYQEGNEEDSVRYPGRHFCKRLDAGKPDWCASLQRHEKERSRSSAGDCRKRAAQAV